MSSVDLSEQIQNMDDDLAASAMMESEMYSTHSSSEPIDIKEEIYFEEVHFESEKKWCVVEFDDGVQLVPLQWITNGNWCHFPNYKSSIRYEKAVKNYELSTSSWPIYAIKIMGIYDSYDMAKVKLREVENYQSEESPERVNRRKRRAQCVDLDSNGDFRRKRYSACPRATPSVAVETVVDSAPSFSSGIEAASTETQQMLMKATELFTNFNDTSNQTSFNPADNTVFGNNVNTSEQDFRKKMCEDMACVKRRLVKIERMLQTNSHTSWRNDGLSVDLYKEELEILMKKLPMHCVESLNAVEDLIKNEPRYEYCLIHHLSRIGGHNLHLVTKFILTRLFTDKFASEYSWVGAKGKKPLHSLHLSKIVIKCIQKNLNCTEVDAVNGIKNWLRHAADRCTRLEHKMYDKTVS